MKPVLDEQEPTIYASEAQTIQEPTGSDYSQGVRVGRTIPAKWWNWLFKAVTSRLLQAFNDVSNIFTELKNFVEGVGITPSALNNTQVTQAVAAHADKTIEDYLGVPLTLWQKEIKFAHGSSAAFSQNTVSTLEHVGKKVFAVISVAGYNNKQLIYTENGDYWKNSGLWAYSFGVAYKDNLYYVLTLSHRWNTDVTPNVTMAAMSLKTTVDFVHYTEIFYAEASLGTNSNPLAVSMPMMVQVGDDLYLIDTYDDNTYRIDGSTLTVSQGGVLNPKFTQFRYSWAYAWWISYRATRLSVGRYVAKNLMLYNGTWTVFINKSLYSEIYELNYIQLEDGVLAKYAFDDIRSISSDGTDTRIPAYNFGLNGQYDLVDCVTVRTSSSWGSISYGGVDLIPLPQYSGSPVKIGGVYYLLYNEDISSNSKLYSKSTGRFTSNINDYTLIRELDDHYSEMSRMQDSIILYKGTGREAYLTNDLGEHVVPVSFTDGTQAKRDDFLYCTPIKVFGHTYVGYLYSAVNRHNRVSGGTLYLQ